MTTNRQKRSDHTFLAFSGVLISLFFPQVLCAQPQPTKQTPQMVDFVIDDKEPVAKAAKVDLRPNNDTEFAFKLTNKSGQIVDVALKVIQIVDGKEMVVAETEVKKLGKDAETIVNKFDKKGTDKKGTDKKDSDKKDSDKKDIDEKDIDRMELVGQPPFKLQLQGLATGLPLMKRDIELTIREPKDYVGATAKFDPDEGEFRVDVKLKNDVFGPRSVPVELVPGLGFITKKGLFDQTLTGPKPHPKQNLPLIAEEVEFEPGSTEGEMNLTVDGYERAYTYIVPDDASGAINARPANELRVRIGVPRYMKPKAKLEVPLEIDGPLAGNYQVQLGLDRTGDVDDLESLSDPDLHKFTGLRQRKAMVSVSATGKLVCRTDVRDWKAVFDTSKIRGRNVYLRVAILKDGKKEDLTVAPESRPLMATTEPDDRALEIRSVFALMTIDDSVPEIARFDLPKEGPVGELVEVRAAVKDRKATQAPVGRAILIKGKAPKDENEKIKDADILAEGVEDTKKKEWIFFLPPQGKPEPLMVSVMFMTVTGSKAATTSIIMYKPGTGAAKKLYTIKGHVKIGMLGQKDLKVVLRDAKGNVKDEVMSVEKGEFVFENVEPGMYFVASREGFRNRSGQTKVTVPDKDSAEKKVTLSLFTPGK